MAFCGSALHYLNLIVVITCSVSLMITGLATAFIDALLFYNSREVIDIAGLPLNLDEALVYE